MRPILLLLSAALALGRNGKAMMASRRAWRALLAAEV